MIELHVVTEVVRYANATNTRSCDIFGHRIHFGFFFTVFDRPKYYDMSILTRCIFVLIHLPERFQIDAIPIKTLSELVWTESLNTSKCMRFQTRTQSIHSTGTT